MGKGIRQSASELRERLAALESQMVELEALSKRADGVASRFELLEQKEKEVTTLLSSASSKATAATTMHDGIVTQKAQIDAVAATAGTLKKEVADGKSDLADAISSFGEVEKEYKNFHTEKVKEIDLKLKKIDDLLRGATSVGLGTSFEKRRQTYFIPRVAWLVAAAVSIITIICVSVGNGDNILKVSSWDMFWLAIMRKLPVITPSVFVAYYSFHQYGILSRLEEEYAHKTIMSWAFEGYRTELLKNESTKTRIDKLVEDVLDAIKQPSARIYDTSTRPVTPVDGSAEKIIDAIRSVSSKDEQPHVASPKIEKLPIAITSVITALGVSLMWLIARMVGK